MFAMDTRELRSSITMLQRQIQATVKPVEIPSPQERELVEAWQAEIEALGALIRQIDDLLIRAHALQDDAVRAELEEQGRALRHKVYSQIARLNPEDAWFWTEEWQAKEREANAARATGGAVHESTDDFLAALDQHRAARANA